MKKILSFFVVFFGFYGVLNAGLTSEERFAEVKKLYPQVVKFDSSITDSKAFVYAEIPADRSKSSDLIDDLRDFFEKNSEATLILDTEKGGRLENDEGELSLQYLYADLKNIIITNVQGNVTKIGDNFCPAGVEFLELNLPALTMIGNSFFGNMHYGDSLSLKLNLPSLETIGNFFYGDHDIDVVDLSSLTTVGERFFADCKKLKSVYFPSLTNAGGQFFDGCTNLESLNAPLLKTLGDDCLKDLKNLKSVHLPALETVGKRFLCGADNLELLDLPMLKNTRYGFLDIQSSWPFEHLKQLSFDHLSDSQKEVIFWALLCSNHPSSAACYRDYWCQKPRDESQKKAHFKRVQAVYPQAVFFDENLKPQEKDLVYVDSWDFIVKHDALKAFFEQNPRVVLLIDFEKGDGFVDDNGTLHFYNATFPETIKNIVISNMSKDITNIGDCFLCGRKKTGVGFDSIDINLPALKSVGDMFLYFWDRIDSFTSYLPLLENIGASFLAYSGLTSIAFDYPSLKTVDENFLSGNHFECLNLDFPLLTHIDYSFLKDCWKLKSLHLHFPQLMDIGFGLPYDCYDLQSLSLKLPLLEEIDRERFFNINCFKDLTSIELEGCSKNVQKALVSAFRESNNHGQRTLGMTLYMKYLSEPNPELEEALKPWNFDVLKAMTPLPLEDLDDFDKEKVLSVFDDLMALMHIQFQKDVKEGQYKDLYKKGVLVKTKEECIEDTQAIYANYEQHLRPIIRFVFGEDISVTWAMYDEEKPHIAIVFKHMCKKFRSLDYNEKATYMTLLLEGFAHCQSRQGAVINNIGTKMGLLAMKTNGQKADPFYDLINSFKEEQFYKAVGEIQKKGNTHEQMRWFTALDGKLGLPVVLHLVERINPLADGEIEDIWAIFFKVFFTPDLLGQFLVEEISKANDQEEKMIDPENSLSYVNLRYKIWKAEGKAVKEDYLQKEGKIHDIEAYFEQLNGKKVNIYEEALAETEVLKLLKLVWVLKSEEVTE